MLVLLPVHPLLRGMASTTGRVDPLVHGLRVALHTVMRGVHGLRVALHTVMRGVRPRRHVLVLDVLQLGGQIELRWELGGRR